MKFQIINDLHLDLYPNRIKNFKPLAPYLIIAGDSMIYDEENFTILLRLFSSLFEKIIVIFGNHECVGFDLKNIKNIISKHSSDKVIILENNYVDINEYRIFGSIFWSNNENRALKWNIQ